MSAIFVRYSVADTRAHCLLGLLDGRWRHLGDVVRGNPRHWIKPAQDLRRRGLAESCLINSTRGLSWRLTAQGIEARRAETREAGLGAKHESPVAEGHAPNPDRHSHQGDE